MGGTKPDSSTTSLTQSMILAPVLAVGARGAPFHGVDGHAASGDVDVKQGKVVADATAEAAAVVASKPFEVAGERVARHHY